MSEFSVSTLTTPKLSPCIERMPLPVALAPVRPGRRNETVSTSLEAAHGQTASGRSPLLVNTAKNWSHDDKDHGLAPSATKSIRSDDRLMSR